MLVLKCKMCGGELNVSEDQTVCECEYCGTKQTLPRIDNDRKLNLYDRANHYRRTNDYDKAISIYEQILNEDLTDAEAYWSLVLCRYGIEYVEDPLSHKRIPTVNRTQYTSIFADEDYKRALEYATPEQKTIYEEEARTIEEIQKGILDVSSKEDPFDIFICYKETDDKGRRTIDSVIANDLYHELVNEGYKVFFSRITLENKLGEAYEPYIFAALNSAKVMVVLGTRPEYFNSVWVKNEWSRYLSLIKKGEKKTLIPAYRDMDPYDLPEEFSHLQSLDMSKIGFMQDLLRGIKKITNSKGVYEKRNVSVLNSDNKSIDPLLKRAFIFLEDGDFQSADEYCDKVLDMDPENGRAYLGKLMVQEKKNTISALFDSYKELFDEDGFARENAKSVLEDISDIVSSEADEYNIPDYLEKDTIKDLYNHYNSNYDSRVTFRQLQKQNIIDKFNNDRLISRVKHFSGSDILGLFDEVIGAYDQRIKDAEEEDAGNIGLIKQGFIDFLNKTDEKVREMHEDAINRREEDYQNFINEYENAEKTDLLDSLIEKFEKLSSYKESSDYIDRCRTKIETIKEKERLDEEKRKKKIRKRILLAVLSVAALLALLVYYNNVVVPKNKYTNASDLLEQGEYEQAAAIFDELGDYEDAKEKYLETLYREGNDFLKNGKYAEAISLFESLDSYEDSKEKLIESTYGYGKQFLEKNDYDNAIKTLNSNKDYKDSAQLISKATYGKAVSLREKKEYDAAISLFEELGDYEDSQEQMKLTEKEKEENSVKVPSIVGKTLDSARTLLEKAGLVFSAQESTEKNKKVGTVISVSPEEGTLVLIGSTVKIVIAKGSSEYSNYEGDRNTVALFQIGINSSGNNLRIRSAPTTADDNKIENAKSGNVYNVYETMENEGYTWYRIGTGRWIAYDAAWISRDTKCDQYHGDFEIYNVKIAADDHMGVYSNPVENENQRSWVRAVYNGEVVKVYYTFNNGSHVWYKIGINEWIKDFGGDRVVRVN